MQQINFYTHLAKPPKYNLTLATFKKAGIIFSILLIAFYFIGQLYTYWQQHTLTQLNFQQKAAEIQLNTLTKRYLHSPIKPLRFQNQALIAEIQAKQTFLKNNNIKAGYALFLAAFAKAINSGVWLTRIQIEQDSQQIILTGSALNSADVLQFMQNLTNQYLFKDMKFKLAYLKNSDPKTSNINFILSTKALMQDGPTTKKPA